MLRHCLSSSSLRGRMEEANQKSLGEFIMSQIGWWIFQAGLLMLAATAFSWLWSSVSGPYFSVPEPWSNPGWFNTVCIFWLAGVSKKLYKCLRYWI